MIRPTLDQLIIMFDIHWYHVAITVAVIIVFTIGCTLIIVAIARNWTRNDIENRELPFLHDKLLNEANKKNDDLEAENKTLKEENHEYFKKTEGAKMALGVEKGVGDE